MYIARRSKFIFSKLEHLPWIRSNGKLDFSSPQGKNEKERKLGDVWAPSRAGTSSTPPKLAVARSVTGLWWASSALTWLPSCRGRHLGPLEIDVMRCELWEWRHIDLVFLFPVQVNFSGKAYLFYSSADSQIWILTRLLHGMLVCKIFHSF